MNVFKQLLRSFVSAKDMASFRFQGIGKTILYVFILMFVALLPTFISMSISISSWLEETTQVFESSVPEFQILSGELVADREEPLIKETNDFTFIFDATGTLKESDIEEYDNALALLQTEAVYQTEGVSQTLPYASLSGIDVSKESILSFLANGSQILFIFLPILFVVMYIFQTGLKFIGITFLALIGLLIAKTLNKTLLFKKVWIMSAYAVTIPTIFFSWINAVNVFIPMSLLLYWITAIIILYVVTKEVPSPNKAS